MGEHGSFVSENFLCPKCREAVISTILKHTCVEILIRKPIVAGTVKESYFGGELLYMQYTVLKELYKHICHKVRIAVLCENATVDALVIEPGNEIIEREFDHIKDAI